MSIFFFQYHGAPIEYMDVLSDCNLVFTILFTIECVMKLSSFGPKAYFKVSLSQFFTKFYLIFKLQLMRWDTLCWLQDSWNTFDFITVVGSIVDATQLVNVGFLRLFRAARLIKLLRRSVSIRILLFTFVQSIKVISSIMSFVIPVW